MVNTDVAVFGGPGLTGCVGIFCTCIVFINSCFTIPLGICFAFKAEHAVVVHAIEYAWSFSWRWLWLESDLAYLVALHRSRSCWVARRWHHIWERCLDYLA